MTFGSSSTPLNKEQLLEHVDKVLSSSLEPCDDPMVHKVMLMEILSNFIHWHTRMGHEMFSQGDIESGTAWLRDAGKFQGAMALVAGINVGNNDFITPID